MTYNVTKIEEARHILGDLVGTIRDVDITSYTNPGGEAVTASTFGLTRLDVVLATSRESLIHDLKWIGTALRLTVSSTGLEAANAVDGGVWRVLAIGK